jgi:predicted lipoprotein with Yx(FWY)xxD motif
VNVRIATIAGAILLLSACGGSKSSNSHGSANAASSSTSGTAASTVSTRKVSGAGIVLVDSQGDALYFPAQEQGGKILCTGGCTAVWVPLTLPAGMAAPTAASNLPGKLGVVKRPGGKRQVTWNGDPLYTFAQDGSGKVTGNGATDSFGGVSFTWHVALVGTRPAPSTTTQGGYGY